MKNENDMNKMMIDYYEYFDLLEDFDLIPVENYTLDKVYNEVWFRNDLIKIIESYDDHKSNNYLNHKLSLWCSFLHGVKTGLYK